MINFIRELLDPWLKDVMSADTLIVYSLDPLRRITGDCDSTSLEAPTFHGFPIVHEVVVVDSNRKNQLISALYDRFDAPYPADAPRCFIPHHGLRAVCGDRVTDLVICFQCYTIVAYRNGKKSSGTRTSQSPRSVFDQILDLV